MVGFVRINGSCTRSGRGVLLRLSVGVMEVWYKVPGENGSVESNWRGA